MATVQEVTRNFIIKINGNTLEIADPNPELSPEEVQDILSNHYPQLLNAKVVHKGIIDGVDSYEFATIAGTKG